MPKPEHSPHGTNTKQAREAIQTAFAYAHGYTWQPMEVWRKYGGDPDDASKDEYRVSERFNDSGVRKAKHAQLKADGFQLVGVYTPKAAFSK